MTHFFYITPEEYATAEKNGIKPAMLDRRIRAQGWKKERAITTPPRKLTDRKYWYRLAKQNGISYDTFMSRINRGWDMERAAHTPLQTPEQAAKQQQRATDAVRVFPKNYTELAKQNGIPYHTFFNRVKYSGWEIERAATEPVWSYQKIGRFGAKRLREREGDWAALLFGKRKGSEFKHE